MAIDLSELSEDKRAIIKLDIERQAMRNVIGTLIGICDCLLDDSADATAEQIAQIKAQLNIFRRLHESSVQRDAKRGTLIRREALTNVERPK